MSSMLCCYSECVKFELNNNTNYYILKTIFNRNGISPFCYVELFLSRHIENIMKNIVFINLKNYT